MAAPVEIGVKVTGDATSAVRAFDQTTDAARRTDAAVQAVHQSTQRMQNTWGAPNPAARYAGSTLDVGTGRTGVAGTATSVLLGQLGTSIPGAPGIAAAALADSSANPLVTAAVAATAALLGLSKGLKSFGDELDKVLAGKGDPAQATSAAGLGAAVESLNRTSLAGRVARGIAGQIAGPFAGMLGLGPKESASRKWIDSASPAELLVAMPYLGDDADYARQVYESKVNQQQFRQQIAGVQTGPGITNVTFNAGIIGSTQDAMTGIQRAQRNNGQSQTITAPRAG